MNTDITGIRRAIEDDLKAIQSVAQTLSVFQQFDRDTVKIDPVVLGIVHEMITERVLNVYEVLNETTPTAPP